MSKNINPISTLEYYNYWEQNNFKSAKGAYQVKVSDKDGNIITIEKDGSLFACVGLSLSENVLKLIDKAHDDSLLAEVEFPNAGYINNCRFDAESNSILFDVVTLKGDIETVEIDVESLVDVYEAGQGIEIGEKSSETGKKPISIKLANGEDLLTLSDDGLGISEKVATDEELASAISGKADLDYVDEIKELVDTIDESVDEINNRVDEVQEELDDKASRSELQDLSDEVGEIETVIEGISGITGSIITLVDKVDEIDGKVNVNTEEISFINDRLDGIDNVITDINNSIADEQEARELGDAALSGAIDDNKTKIIKKTDNLPENVKESYALVNALGEELGESINIFYDSSIESIEFVHHNDETGEDGQFLKIVYLKSDGTRQVSYIDLSQIVIESEFKDGLETIDGKVYVKIDPSSDGYLSVSENGVKLTGIYSFFNQLLEVNNQQWAAINNEVTSRTDADRQLWDAINNETSERQAADSNLQDAIDNETANRESADEQIQEKVNTLSGSVSSLEEDLAQEIQDRKDADIEIVNGIDERIDSKVEVERLRAETAEQELQNAINSEVSRATEAEEDLDRKYEGVSQELNSKINLIKRNVDGIREDLDSEIYDRIEEDNAIKADVQNIKDTYATIDYVDTKDREILSTAVSSAYTESKSYTDVKLNDLEAELKQYSDEGDDVVKESVNKNSTKINAISNLIGVEGDDTSNYDDSGNGILDVLHREFHALEDEIGFVINPTLQKTNKYEVAFGEYNISHTGDEDADKTMFSIGNGTDDENRRNAFEVRKDGTVYMWIEGEFMAVNNLIGMLAHEIYDQDSRRNNTY